MKYKNIVQIDDDSEDCDLFFEALQAISSAKYLAIHSAVEALVKLETGIIVPDIIFLDLNMPKMNGAEFLYEVRKRKILKDVPVIIFSTSPVSEMILQTKNLGAYDYITKPNSYNDLKTLLQARIS